MKVIEPARAPSASADGALPDARPAREPGAVARATHAPAPPPALRLEGVAKRYGGFEAVRGVSLDVQHGEFVTLLGPSGSGKTTTLMMIAGFVDPTAGRIHVDGQDVTAEPPHRRNIGMVFQNYALFPHLSVLRNVAFPLEVRKRPAAEVRERARAALEIVRLAGLGDRYPAELSGGQQQRVALARALVFDPPLLLMDEPLGALDKKLREHMQIELLKLQDKLGVTVIYVTHDQEEALVMSDRVVVMSDGAIQQAGRADELYRRPHNRFVADFIGEANLIEGRVVDEGSSPTLALPAGLAVSASSNRSWKAGERAFLVLRPECVRLGTRGEGCSNRLEGTIERIIYVGDVSRVLVTLASGQTVAAKLQNGGIDDGMMTGERVCVGWDSDSTWIVGETAPASPSTADPEVRR